MLNQNHGFMKKIALILVVCFIIAFAVSACNEKSCPAYTEAETSQTGNNGWDFQGVSDSYFL